MKPFTNALHACRATGIGLLLAGTLLLAVAFKAAPAQAQQAPPTALIGLLSDRNPDGFESDLLGEFRRGLAERGWIENDNLRILPRYAGNDAARLPAMALELVESRVDLIFVTTARAAVAAMNATTSIPIVFNLLSDPVEQGIVAALARPGGNLTGIAINSSTLIPKRLQLLKEAVPRLTRVAVLIDPDQDEACEAAWKTLQAPADAMGVGLQKTSVDHPTDYARVFAGMARRGIEAVLVPATTRFYNDARQIAALAAVHRMVFLPPVGDVAEAESLLTYGPLQTDAYRRAASYVDRILRGANPATLPVEQSTHFELVLNLKVAKALGVVFPRSLRVRADRMIK